MSSQGEMPADWEPLLGAELKEAKKLAVHLQLVSCFP